MTAYRNGEKIFFSYKEISTIVYALDLLGNESERPSPSPMEKRAKKLYLKLTERLGIETPWSKK